MSKLKTYRVTAVQPVFQEALILTTSQKEAIKLAKANQLNCGASLNWNEFDIGDWSDFQAEEVDND